MLIRQLQTLALILVLGLSLLAPMTASAAGQQGRDDKEIRIGILALRGTDHTIAAWQPTADYLRQRMPDYRFRIVPLGYDEIELVVAENGVEFLIANSAIHVMMAEAYGVSPIATILNRLDDYDSSLFGGVLFRRIGARGEPTLKWVVGKRCMAVDPTSFGGFLTVLRELKQAGINPYDDCASLKFAGTHDAVVLAVLNGEADVGTVRTYVLERMAAEGKVDLAQIEVIAPMANGRSRAFPYLLSTRLYPEWPISKLSHVSDRLARDVVHVLFDITPDSAAARGAQIAGWNTAADYLPVEALLRELELPPYEHRPVSLRTFIRDQPLAMYLIVGGAVVTLGFVLLLLLANRRLQTSKGALEELSRSLEARVDQRTRALEDSKRQLEDLATHDPLTGLLNRRALEVQILTEMNRVNRYGQPLSVFMVDIDYFKNVNDSFGHAAGDSVLVSLSQLLHQMLRNTDIIARYGGEEFVVVLPMTGLDAAEQLAHRLCVAVASHDMVLPDGQIIRITISIGVTGVNQAGNARWEALIDTADQAMYAAKQNGRNRVCVV